MNAKEALELTKNSLKDPEEAELKQIFKEIKAACELGSTEILYSFKIYHYEKAFYYITKKLTDQGYHVGRTNYVPGGNCFTIISWAE